MSLIDDDNNIALALGGGVAVATDDPELLSDNNLNKNAAGTNQESDRSNAAGDDQAVGTRAQADTEDSASGDGNFIENDHNKVAIDSFNKEVKVGDISVDKSKTVGDVSFDKSKTETFGDGDQSTTDGVVKYNDQANGDGDLRTADGDIKYNDQANGDGDLRTADGDVKHNNLNDGGGDHSTAYGDVWDKSGDNRDNKDYSGNNRDFDDLLDFEDADMSYNYGAIANQGVQQNLEGGGFQLNSQQNANIYSYGDAYGDYSFNNYNEGNGGDGGDGVDGGKGGDGSGGPISVSGDGGYEPCEAQKMAEDCHKDDCRPKCPDPCCDDGSWSSDGNGGGGGGGGKGDHTGGAGGAGGYGFQITLGDANSTANGGGDGGATSDGSSAHNTNSSAGHNFEAWNNNITVGANVINQDFSILAGDFS